MTPKKVVDKYSKTFLSGQPAAPACAAQLCARVPPRRNQDDRARRLRQYSKSRDVYLSYKYELEKTWIYLSNKNI